MLAAQKHLRTCVALVVLGLAVGAPRQSLAADDAPSDEALSEARRSEAKAKYQSGVEAYEKHRYAQAVELFLEADKLAPSAPLSFNIGRAYERLGDDTSALRWYRDYQRRSANAPNATDVRELVKRLALVLSQKGVQQVTVLSLPTGATVSVDEQAVGVTPWTGELAPGKHHLSITSRGHADVERDFELEPTEPLDLSFRLEARAPAQPSAALRPETTGSSTQATTPQLAPRSDHSAKFGPWPWISVGVGAAALGGALTFELLRRSAEDDAKHEPVQVEFQSAVDRMQSRKMAARVFLGVGGAALATGAVLLVLDHTRRSSPAQVGFSCVPGECSFSAEGRF